jgi:hypothetical protein
LFKFRTKSNLHQFLDSTTIEQSQQLELWGYSGEHYKYPIVNYRWDRKESLNEREDSEIKKYTVL